MYNKLLISSLAIGSIGAYYYYKKQKFIEREIQFKKILVSGKIFNENIKDKQIVVLDKNMLFNVYRITSDYENDCLDYKYNEGLNTIKFEDFMNWKYKFFFTNEDSAKKFQFPKENIVYSIIIPNDAYIICNEECCYTDKIILDKKIGENIEFIDDSKGIMKLVSYNHYNIKN
jgi:hypothetical protein